MAKRQARLSLRKRVFGRDGGVCAECRADCEKMRRVYLLLGFEAQVFYAEAIGVNDDQKTFWDADHVIEIADGGYDGLENIQTLCVGCHGKKTREWKTDRPRPTAPRADVPPDPVAVAPQPVVDPKLAAMIADSEARLRRLDQWKRDREIYQWDHHGLRLRKFILHRDHCPDGCDKSECVETIVQLAAKRGFVPIVVDDGIISYGPVEGIAEFQSRVNVAITKHRQALVGFLGQIWIPDYEAPATYVN